MMPTVTCEKPSLPTLWLDTSVVIKLAKIKKGEALQQIEVDRCNRLHGLVYRLVREGKLLCPESDQEEEYAALRLDDKVHSMFAQLSLGISLTHRQGILDSHILKGMEAFVKQSDMILLPTRSYFHGDPVRRLHEACRERFIVTVGPLKNSEMLQSTLPSSVSHNPFVCHSYENTGGVGGILPILGCADVSTFGPSDVSTFCRAIIGLAACASAKKASRE